MCDSRIFKAAVKLSPERRAAYLDQACGTDQALRGEVESRLRAHEDADSFLAVPAVNAADSDASGTGETQSAAGEARGDDAPLDFLPRQSRRRVGGQVGFAAF